MSKSTIEMNQNIRVKIEPRYKMIYNGLKTHAVGEFHELFFLCVCLGCKSHKKVPLQKREDAFWSTTVTPDEWYAFYAIHLYENELDFSSLGDDEAIIMSMEEYANAGIEILLEEFLCDYVKKDSAGNYTVEHTEQISKELLMKIRDWCE